MIYEAGQSTHLVLQFLHEGQERGIETPDVPGAVLLAHDVIDLWHAIFVQAMSFVSGSAFRCSSVRMQ